MSLLVYLTSAALGLLLALGLALLAVVDAFGQALPPGQACEQKLEAEHVQVLDLRERLARMEFTAVQMERALAAAQKQIAAEQNKAKVSSEVTPK